MARKRTKADKRGRPTLYTEELAEAIVSRVGAGQTLTKTCDELGLSRFTVAGWQDAHPEFYARLSRARLAQADVEFDEIKDLVDGAPANKNAQTKAKNQMDARKFRVARLNAQLYSEKAGLTLSGDPEKPVQLTGIEINYDVLTAEEAQQLRRLARKLASASTNGRVRHIE